MESFVRLAPMKWIFSEASPSASTSRIPAKLTSFDSYGEEGREMPSYGPQLQRKGNIKFVRAKGVVEGKGKERSGDGERKVRSLYDDMDPVPSTSTSFLRSTPSTLVAHAKSTQGKSTSVTPDLDLTLSDSPPSSDTDDDLIICDSLTSLPLPPLPRSNPLTTKTRKAKLQSITDMLADFVPRQAPVVVPTQYGIGMDTIGWRMLSKQGWKVGEGLGRGAGAFVLDEEGGLIKDRTLGAVEGIKVPIQAIERMNRSGLGIAQDKGKAKPYRERDNGVKMKKKGKRERGREREKQEALTVVAKRYAAEKRERKELLAYLNR